MILLPAEHARGQAGDDLDGIRKRLADANAQTARVLGEIKSLDAKIFSVGRAIARDERETARLRSEIQRTETRIADLESQVQRLRRSSNARARQMYKTGPASVLAVLFTADTLGDLPKLGMFWETLAEKDGRTLAEATRLRGVMAEERVKLASSVEKLKAQVRKADAEQASLKGTRDARASSLEELKVVIQEAIAAEKAVLAARAAAVKKPAPGPCSPGVAARDQRLAALLDWYAPASGDASFLPPKLGSTGVVVGGSASWYGPGFDGCRSSSGATFRAAQMTAASLSLPLGTLLKVAFGGRAVVVVITDRGPYVEGRVLDLSAAAARSVGLSGIGEVSMEILLPNEPAPPFP
jgi:rare lipoprotein A